MTEIPADHKTIWYRLSRRADDYRIEYSFDGSTYHMMRIAHLWEGADTIQIGIYACSPEESFLLLFSQIFPWENAYGRHAMASSRMKKMM